MTNEKEVNRINSKSLNKRKYIVCRYLSKNVLKAFKEYGIYTMLLKIYIKKEKQYLTDEFFCGIRH